jgi:lipopolysaccharide export system permease protein
MLFTQSLRKELFAAASAVFITLLTIVLTVSLVRILGQAAAGRADPAAILLLIVLSSLNYLPVLLALTAFISVLLVMTRLYRDSEMVVWFASGVSLQQFIHPVLFFVLPFVVLIWLFSLLVAPWANQQVQELRAIYEQRDDMARVSPGRFIESASTGRVFFVDGYDVQRRTVNNVFVVLREPTAKGERVSVLAAKGGEIEIRNGER